MTSRKPSKKNFKKFFTLLKEVENIKEFSLKSNGLRVVYLHIPDTGVITSNIVYHVGSRDEMPGETGLAHMLEHMLFKPTTFDIARKQSGAAMVFEREIGVLLNATTSKDRTNYYFSYPKEHLSRALRIEAERMNSVVLTDKEFLPERTNVLSEFDMYNGMPEFALEKNMLGAAFMSHPYGHEVIGSREDIESYTTKKLGRFYETHYMPNNATLIVVGDVTEDTLFEEVYTSFSSLQSKVLLPKAIINEPTQEGIRHISIERPSTTNIVAIGIKHPGFPSREWNETVALLKILADGPDSILHRALVDTGKAAQVHSLFDTGCETSVAMILITLSAPKKHQTILDEALTLINSVRKEVLAAELKKTIAQIVDTEPFSRDSSFKIAAELTEYVAAKNWPAYFETEKSLREITPAVLVKRRDTLFNRTQITTGFFIGTK